jgi:NADPH oxidase
MWLFMQVPEVSPYQWHPFTISSAPDDPYISVHIRQVGDWTFALGERLGCTKNLANQVNDEIAKGLGDEMANTGEFIDITHHNNRPMPVLRIDGPFGAPAEDVFTYEVAVLIGTGIGVTPFASILKNIWFRQKQNKLGALRRVEFIWMNRDTSAFEWFAALMQDLEARQTDPDFLRISTYLTAKLSEDQLYNIALNDAGAEFDAITSLRSRTSYGRPNFPQILGSIRKGIDSGRYLPGRESSLTTRVAVFYCGPNTLAKPLKLYVKEAGTNSVKFSFHKEHF